MDVQSALLHSTLKLAEGPLWAAVLLKVSGLLALGWLGYLCLRRANPRWRVLLLRGMAAGVILIPIATLLMPGIELTVERPESVAESARVERGPTEAARSRPASTEIETVENESEAPLLGARHTDELTSTSVRQWAKTRSLQRGKQWLLPGFWVAAVLVLVMRLALGWRRVRGIVKRSLPAPDSVTAQFRTVSKALDCKRSVAVRVATDLTSPFLTGLRRPVLLLPERMCDSSYDEELPGVIAHELSHLLSRDLLWSHIIHWISILLWFHPLVWRMFAAHASACEEVCDAMSANYVGDREAYSRTLARVAVELVSCPPLVGGIPMARVSEISQRLSLLKRRVFSAPLARGYVIPAVLAGLAAIALIGALQIALAEAGGAKLFFRLIDADTDNGLAMVAMKIRIDEKSFEVLTDEDGRYVIDLPEKTPDYLGIHVACKPYVPKSVSWSAPKGDLIPDVYTLRLERGASIGGIIVNEDSEPIEDVEVYLHVFDSRGGPERVASGEDMVTTDVHGRWQWDRMPTGIDDVRIRLAHADYIGDDSHSDRPTPPMQSLRDMTSVMVMKRGFRVEGVVLSEDGMPISGARVEQGYDAFHAVGSVSVATTTDEKGRFVFPNCKLGEMGLTARARKYAPEFKRVIVEPGMAPVEFQIGPGGTIRGRVVDDAGRPVEGASVGARKWRGLRLLRWTTQTDAEGRFVWVHAPLDEVELNIGKKGYMAIFHESMVARDEQYLVTLHKELEVSGSVIDAETREPVETFTCFRGIRWENGRMSWPRFEPIQGKDGHYSVTFHQPYPALLVCLEADGYMPAISRDLKADEGKVTFDFELTKASGPTGIVQLPDGTPVAGAEVILSTPTETVSITNGRSSSYNYSNNLTVVTGADGRFSLPPQDGPYRLVIFHDRGCAIVDGDEPAASRDVILEPWGRVEGTLRIGAKPGINERINLWSTRPPDLLGPRIHFDYRGTTDEDGGFVFDRVQPGQWRVAWSSWAASRTGGWSSTALTSIAAEVESGETVYVTIGGTGRPVIGRVVPPPESDIQIGGAESRCSLEPKEPTSSSVRYSAKLKSDGTFRFEEVVSGAYALKVVLFKKAEPQAGALYSAGSVSLEFEVPEIAGGRSDEPLDLGTLELEIAER